MILRSKSLSVLFRERAKLQYSDAFIGDLATANAFDSLVPAPAHSANWQPMCAITCTFIEVQTMSGAPSSGAPGASSASRSEGPGWLAGRAAHTTDTATVIFFIL